MRHKTLIKKLVVPRFEEEGFIYNNYSSKEYLFIYKDEMKQIRIQISCCTPIPSQGFQKDFTRVASQQKAR